MKFDGSIGQYYVRVRSGQAYKPPRSLRELAEEFGVSSRALSAMLRCAGIAPLMRTKSIMTKNVWYDPIVVRAWWKARS